MVAVIAVRVCTSAVFFFMVWNSFYIRISVSPPASSWAGHLSHCGQRYEVEILDMQFLYIPYNYLLLMREKRKGH